MSQYTAHRYLQQNNRKKVLCFAMQAEKKVLQNEQWLCIVYDSSAFIITIDVHSSAFWKLLICGNEFAHRAIGI